MLLSLRNFVFASLPNRTQTSILPVHIKSQLSYAAITEKLCIRKLYNLLKKLKESQDKEEY